jgi:hypothetical protein
MAGLIGSLAIALTARTDRFNRGMRGARGQVNRFAGSVSIAQGVLWPFTKALALIGGPLILGRMAMRTAKSTDELTKMARAVGVSTEFLVGAHHAAKLAGVGQESLNNSLHRLNRSIGEAVRQGGEAEARFADLGLDPARLAAKGTEDAFLDVLDALGNMPDATKQADAANRLFSRSYRDLLKIVGRGADDIRAGIREARVLGDTFDEASGQKVERMNDAFTRLWTTIRGGTRRMVAWIAPAVTRVVHGLIRIRVGAGVVWDFVAETFGPRLVKRVADWGTSIAGVLVDTGRTWFQAIAAWEAGGGLRRIFAHIQNAVIAVRIVVAQTTMGVRELAGEILGVAASAQRVYLELRGAARAAELSPIVSATAEALREAERLEKHYRSIGADLVADAFAVDVAQLRTELGKVEGEYNRLLDDLAALQKGETGLEATSRRMLEGVKDQAEVAADILAKTPWVDPNGSGQAGRRVGRAVGRFDGFRVARTQLANAMKDLDEVLKSARVSGSAKRLATRWTIWTTCLKAMQRATTPAALERGTAAAFAVGAEAQAQARLATMMQRDAKERRDAEKRAERQREAQIEAARRAAEGLAAARAAGAAW